MRVQQTPRKTPLSNALFNKVHGSQLIYNTCWEDPRIDRQLLELGSDSRLMMITSAGCNAIEYLLDDPKEIVSVDLNHRQNALLELKRAVILNLEYDDLFQWFGKGFHPEAESLYADFRQSLPDYARHYWDKRIRYFRGKPFMQSFYYRGSSGLAAWSLKQTLFRLKPKVRYQVYELLEATSLEEQRELYFEIEKRLWNKGIEWLLNSPMVMNMVGVPRAQLDLINRDVPGGLVSFVKRCMRNTFTQLSLADNYFWRVYIRGEYTRDCCPEYLKEQNFQVLRDRLDRLSTHTVSFAGLLEHRQMPFSHFILLDHQDWLAWFRPDLLAEEWDQIRTHASPGTKVLMRSAGVEVDFTAPHVDGWLQWRNERASELHSLDRVGTYASCHLGVVSA